MFWCAGGHARTRLQRGPAWDSRCAPPAARSCPPAAYARSRLAQPTAAALTAPLPLSSPCSYQCEQTAHGTGCTVKGVCGKTPETTFLQVRGSFRGLAWSSMQGGWSAGRRHSASLCLWGARPAPCRHATPPTAHRLRLPLPPPSFLQQDLLTYSCKGLGCWAHHAVQQGLQPPTAVWSFLHAATFATLTSERRLCGRASPAGLAALRGRGAPAVCRRRPTAHVPSLTAAPPSPLATHSPRRQL